jgi:D-lyxose ketol-isomerase
MTDSDKNITRRNVVKGTALAMAATGLGVGGCESFSKTGGKNMPANPGNTAFYAADGAFDAAGSTKAYLTMMEAFGYPITDALRSKELWVCDFVQRDFAKLGMGGIFFKNATGTYGGAGTKSYKGAHKDDKFGYLGHEIFLLPGQMLPEHRHIGGHEGYGPKMESWQVRYGSVEFFGQYSSGEETLISNMPKSEQPWGVGQDWFKSKYVAKRTAQSGKLYEMADAESWHFQRAGAQGAIVTEYATYHNHVEFSKPGMKFEGSKAL